MGHAARIGWDVSGCVGQSMPQAREPDIYVRVFINAYFSLYFSFINL